MKIQMLCIFVILFTSICYCQETIITNTNKTVCFYFERLNSYELITGYEGAQKYVCQGEPLTIDISSSVQEYYITCSEHKYRRFLNATDECGTYGCYNTSPPNLNISYNGGISSWDYSTSYPDFNDGSECLVVDEIMLSVIPIQTATLNISWTTTRYEPPTDHSFQCEENNYIHNYHYTGEITLNVIESIVPTISASKTKVNPNERFDIYFDCYSNRDWYIEEKCNYTEPFSTQEGSYCSNSSLTFKNIYAPDYSTALTFRGVYRQRECHEVTGYTNEITVYVEEEPNPNACDNDTDILNIESMLADQENQNRIDYHSYESKKSFGSDCNINDIWNNYKSSNSSAQPQQYDMPTELPSVFPFTSKVMDYVSPLAPATNCEVYDIRSATNTILKSAPWITSMLTIEEPLNMLLENCPNFKSTDILSDPIRVVVDNESKCITRYTLPSHILYPGKTTTCFYIDDCDEVCVKTTGIGFSNCGNNNIGEALGKINTFVGKRIFNNNHDRINCN